MQQTALNLIAIGIFSITMTALLGPLLHISPAVPAAIAFGVMGLATVDTLGWNSRGTTLLLDTLSPRQHRERVVRHEAGHFLAASCLGIPIKGYTLTAWEALKRGQPGLGGVEFDTTALSKKALSGGEMQLTLDRFCTVWMAGIAAERLIYGKAEGGQEDKEKLRAALSLAGLPTNTYQQKESWALLQAKSLLEKHQTSYGSLIEAMEQRASVEDCCRIVQEQMSQST